MIKSGTRLPGWISEERDKEGPSIPSSPRYEWGREEKEREEQEERKMMTSFEE